MVQHKRSAHNRMVIGACIAAFAAVPGVALAVTPLLVAEESNQSAVIRADTEQSAADSAALQEDALEETSESNSEKVDATPEESVVNEDSQSVDTEGEEKGSERLAADINKYSAGYCTQPVVEDYSPPASTELRGGDSVLGGETLSDNFEIPKFERLDGGAGAVFAMADNGTYWNWGQVGAGWDGVLLGNGQPTIVYRNSFQNNSPKFTSIAFQQGYAIGLDENCRLWAVGTNDAGQLGTGDLKDRNSWTLLPSLSAIPFASVSVSGHLSGDPNITLATDQHGRVWKWGLGQPEPRRVIQGVLGNSAWKFNQAIVPYTSTDDRNAMAFLIGTTASSNTGHLFYWDVSKAGSSPVEIEATRGLDIVKVTSSITLNEGGDTLAGTGVLALTRDGKVWRVRWDGTAQKLTRFNGVELPKMHDIAANLNLAMMVGVDGSVWTTGTNTFGQLGNGIVGGSAIEYAHRVAGLPGIIHIAAAGETGFAMDFDGKVWAWGSNNGEMAIGCDLPGAAQNPSGSGCVYPTPKRLPLTPAVQITFGEEDDPTSSIVESDDIEWKLDQNGIPTGEIEYTVPEHVAGNVPINIRYGMYDPADAPTPPYTHPIDELTPKGQIGSYTYMLPLKELVTPTDPVGIEEEAEILAVADLPDDKKYLAGAPGAAQFQSESAEVQLSESSAQWNEGLAKVHATADKAASANIRSWNALDGTVFSYNTDYRDSLQQCMNDPMTGAEVKQECRVDGTVQFRSNNIAIYIQKVGKSTGNEDVPMDGSQWRIYSDDNGAPASTPIFDGLEPVSDGTGGTIKGLQQVTLEPGTYWLEESKALEGFQLLAQRVPFEVVASPAEVKTVAGLDESVYSLTSMGTHQDGTPMITVSDVPVVDLPDTSGTRLIGFTALGAALIVLGAGSALMYRARRMV